MPSENGNTVSPRVKKPVLLVTHDDSLWHRWRQLEASGWLPARASSFNAVEGWQRQGHTLVMLDAQTKGVPAWNDSSWSAISINLTIMVGSGHPSDDEATQVVSAGCTGYVHAYSPLTVLDSALTTIAAGGLWLGRSLITRMLRQIDQLLTTTESWAKNLTSREKEVAERAAKGDSNQDIADALGISERTVRAHISAVFDKLGVSDRLKLALKVHGVE